MPQVAEKGKQMEKNQGQIEKPVKLPGVARERRIQSVAVKQSEAILIVANGC